MKNATKILGAGLIMGGVLYALIPLLDRQQLPGAAGRATRKLATSRSKMDELLKEVGRKTLEQAETLRHQMEAEFASRSAPEEATPPEPASVALEPDRPHLLPWILGLMTLGVGIGVALLAEPRGGPERRRRLASWADAQTSAARSRLSFPEGEVRRKASELLDQLRALLDLPREADGLVPDRLLKAQIKDALSGLLEDPRAVQLRVKRGHVVLSGRLSPELHDEVAHCVATVPGVIELDNRLEALESVLKPA